MRSRLAATLVLMIIVTVALAGCLDRLPGGLGSPLPDPPGGGSGAQPPGGEPDPDPDPGQPGGGGEEPGPDPDPDPPGGGDDPGSGTGVVELIQIPVSRSADDGWRDTSSDPVGIWLNTPTIWFGGAPGSYEASAFFRWTNVNIPKGAKILEAKVLVMHAPQQWPGLNKYDTRVDIRGFAYDNLEPFSPSRDVAELQPTTAIKPWDIEEEWSSTEPEWHETPDISHIIQEIVDRSGWRAGNALGLIFESRPGDRSTEYNRVIYAYDSGSDVAPVLYVRFTR